MAHLPPPSVPEIPGASQPKTLYLPAPGQDAILTERSAGRRRSTGMKFPTPQAALAWCIAHDVAFVYFRASVPAQN